MTTGAIISLGIGALALFWGLVCLFLSSQKKKQAMKPRSHAVDWKAYKPALEAYLQLFAKEQERNRRKKNHYRRYKARRGHARIHIVRTGSGCDCRAASKV